MSSATKSHFPQITLYRGFIDTGQYVWSPFVTKVEFRLRHAKVPYKVAVGSPRSAPKGKIPYVDLASDDGDAPTQIEDSSIITKTLADRGIIPDLSANLSGVERAQVAALTALMEERLYFFNMQERWVENYYAQRDKALWAVPYPMRIVVGMLVYRKIVSTLHGQGTGRHSVDEIDVFRRDLWETVDQMLKETCSKAPRASSDEPFWCLGSKEPTDVDAVLFSFACSMLVGTSNPKSSKLIRGLPSVMDYVGRIHNCYFPDYEKWDAND